MINKALCLDTFDIPVLMLVGIFLWIKKNDIPNPDCD